MARIFFFVHGSRSPFFKLYRSRGEGVNLDGGEYKSEKCTTQIHLRRAEGKGKKKTRKREERRGPIANKYS